MSTTLLRTLTEKSPLKFGRYTELRVRSVLNLGLKGRTILVWYYFNLTAISFTDELLNEMGITEKYHIDKPGKAPEEFQKWKWATFSSKDHRQHLTDRIRFDRDRQTINLMNEKRLYSKASLRERNRRSL